MFIKKKINILLSTINNMYKNKKRSTKLKTYFEPGEQIFIMD